VYVMKWQTSLQPSALTRQCDVNHFSAPWNSSSAVHDSTSTWTHVPSRYVASELDDDMKPDNAYIYSTDPDHETEDEEGRTAKQSVVGSEKVVLATDGHSFCTNVYFSLKIFVTF